MNSSSPAIWIVIPAYNEAGKIVEVIAEVRSAGYHNIIVVDDGSHDQTYGNAKNAGALCLRHKLNRGKGAATKTGIEAAKLQQADIIVTMDGDGQHGATDIAKLIKPLKLKKFDVVLGSRPLNTPAMPWYKKMQNNVANILTRGLTGIWVADSQSGMRAYHSTAFNLINTRADRYDYETEVIREIATYKLRFAEIPIKVSYTPYSQGKITKQNLINGFKTLYRLFWNRIGL